MKSKSLFKWFLICALIGYFVIHPILMGFGHLMHQENIITSHSLHDFIFNSFSFQMLPWSITVAFACGTIGYLYRGLRLNEGLLRQAVTELHFSKLRVNKINKLQLQKWGKSAFCNSLSRFQDGPGKKS